MTDKFLLFIKENKLIQKGDYILVGVSGGVDSVVILDMLSKLQKKFDIHLAIAHVNYGLRKESYRDEKFVKELAKKYEFPIFTKKTYLAGSNIEAKARDIRYDFFNKVVKENGLNKIAVAHHKNDLVETFFLNLSRGSGLTGLVSMKPKTNKLIRPMLFATRSDIENYVRKNKLKFVEDVTNKDLKLKRNFIRHKVLPELEKNNPDFVEILARDIEDLREAQRIVLKTTDKDYKKAAKESEGSVSFLIQDLAKTDPYILSEILRKAICFVKGDLRDVSRKNIEDILKLLKEPYGTKETHLGEGLIARRSYDKLEIRKKTKSPLDKPKSVKLEMEKEAVFGKWRLFLEKTDKNTESISKNLVFLDIQKTPTLHVRCRKSGDRIAIGQRKSKSLQDVFIDAKIPRDERDTYPIVVTKSGEIVWIPEIRLSAKFTSAKSSKNLVSLEAIKKK